MWTLRLRHLTFQYHKHLIIRNLNMNFRAGTLNLITGPSGSGKTTLLKLMTRFLKPQCGEIYYDQHPLKQLSPLQLRHEVTIMFQDPSLQFTMRTVEHELIFTLENLQTPAQQIPAKLNNILKKNHLTTLQKRKINTLSGGEKQRLALAIITALNSRVILLDEPFTNVDQHARSQIMQQLIQLKQQKKIIIIVDHDLRDYQKITDHLYLLRNGRLKPIHFKDFSKLFTMPHYHWSLPSGKSSKVFQLKHVTLGYQKPLLSKVNFVFYPHRATLITGPNGTGKSTLFKALLKLIHYSGQITYQDTLITKLRKRYYYSQVNLTFQEPFNQFLKVTVQEELALTWQHRVSKAVSKTMLNDWLRQTGLDHHLQQIVYSLSGGQQKALQLIEVFLNDAPVLLMDEPFQSLDQHLLTFFKTLLRNDIHQRKRTLIVISHQISAVYDLFDYHVQLSDRHLRYTRR